MAAEDVEVVRDSLRIWRDTGEPAWELTHEDIEVHDHDIVDAGEYRGRAGVERWLADWAAAWSTYSMQPEELIDAGERRVVVLVRMRATGRGSRVEVEREDGLLYELRDGLIARLDYYNNRPDALAAAGLAS
jgi:ketosteroid isomerase-like protein